MRTCFTSYGSRRQRRPAIAWLGLIASLWAPSQASWAAADFLEPELAFKASARVADASHVEIMFDVAPGYYLYRERFAFAATGVTLGAVSIPAGTLKFDETFNRKLETHRGRVSISVPVKRAPAKFRLTVTYQGCADKGLCYPPAQLDADVSLVAFGGNGTIRLVPTVGTHR